MIVFLKFPEKGKVKTRLSKVLDDSYVLELYKGFIQDTLMALKPFDHVLIYFFPREKAADLKSWLGEGYSYFLQTGRDLGEKMANAFKDGFQMGYERLLLIGTDIPEISSPVLHQAFRILENRDAVIGPARDGGYYLIGFNRKSFSGQIFFDDMDWSSGHVFERTLSILTREGLSFEKTPELCDIDTSEDLKALAARIVQGGHTGPCTRKILERHEA